MRWANFLAFINFSWSRMAPQCAFVCSQWYVAISNAMASFSKYFSEIVSNHHVTCSNLAHPDDSCTQLLLKNIPYIALGASKFFFPLFFVSCRFVKWIWVLFRYSILIMDSYRYHCSPIQQMLRAKNSSKFAKHFWIQCKRHFSPR